MWPSYASNDMMPKEDLKLAGETMDPTEVITRMMFVLNNFQIYDLEKLDWKKPFDE